MGFRGGTRNFLRSRRSYVRPGKSSECFLFRDSGGSSGGGIGVRDFLARASSIRSKVDRSHGTGMGARSRKDSNSGSTGVIGGNGGIRNGFESQVFSNVLKLAKL